MAPRTWDSDRAYHESLFAEQSSNDGKLNSVQFEEIRTTPLFSADVLNKTQEHDSKTKAPRKLLPQYGLLGKILDKSDGKEKETSDLLDMNPNPKGLVDALGDPVESKKPEPEDKRLFVNMNAPWSAFICGSQGSGKSHTLSCMLENALLPSKMGAKLGELPRQLAGMVFHYDKFTGFSSTQVCEAAYLASAGIPVRVLVSPSNLWKMKEVYENLPGFPAGAKRPKVMSLLLLERQLNVDRMMKLMAVNEKDGRMALYMEVSVPNSKCRPIGNE